MRSDIGTAALSLLSNEAGYDLFEDRLREIIRAMIEAAFEGELAAFPGRCRYDRDADKPAGYLHGHRDSQRVGAFSAETASVPRARVVD